MIPSRKRVAELCDQLMRVSPAQITIDLVQEVIEEAVHSDNPTPDDIGAASYQCSVLLEVYNPILKNDIAYITELENALRQWGADAMFANKALGIDPNK